MTLTPVRLLLLLVLALCAGLVGLWLDQQGHWRNIAWAAPAAKMPEIQTPASLSLPTGTSAVPSFASIQERPLFAPDRRPPPPPAPPPPPDPLANLHLHGIFTGDTPGILARIDGKVRRLLVNDAVGGWKLKSVEGRQATFSQGEKTRQFQLAYAKLNAVTPPPAQTLPAQPQPQPAQATGRPVFDPVADYREEMRKRNELRAARGLPLQLN